MKRTQIYIDEHIFDLLEKESKIEKKTISEIIRTSISEKISLRKKEIIKKMESVYGIWKDKKMDVDEYIRGIRKDRKI